jgi:hypothetical protein
MGKKKLFSFGKLNTKGMAPKLVGNAAGGLVAAAVDGFLLKNMSAPLQSGIKAGIGVLLPLVVKEPIVEGIGNTLIGVSAYNLSKSYVPGLTGFDSSLSGIGRRNSLYKRMGRKGRMSGMFDSSLSGGNKVTHKSSIAL